MAKLRRRYSYVPYAPVLFLIFTMTEREKHESYSYSPLPTEVMGLRLPRIQHVTCKATLFCKHLASRPLCLVYGFMICLACATRFTF